MAIQLFYWQVAFKNGHIMSQFDNEGNEVLVKDFVGPECWGKQVDGSPYIKMSENFFRLLEEKHGIVTKVGWYPFTKRLGRIIEEKQPGFEYILFKNNVKPITENIPKRHYACIKKSIDIKYGLFSNKTTAIMSCVHIGHLPRFRKGIINKIRNFFHPGRMTNHEVNLI